MCATRSSPSRAKRDVAHRWRRALDPTPVRLHLRPAEHLQRQAGRAQPELLEERAVEADRATVDRERGLRRALDTAARADARGHPPVRQPKGEAVEDHGRAAAVLERHQAAGEVDGERHQVGGGGIVRADEPRDRAPVALAAHEPDLEVEAVEADLVVAREQRRQREREPIEQPHAGRIPGLGRDREGQPVGRAGARAEAEMAAEPPARAPAGHRQAGPLRVDEVAAAHVEDDRTGQVRARDDHDEPPVAGHRGVDAGLRAGRHAHAGGVDQGQPGAVAAAHIQRECQRLVGVDGPGRALARDPERARPQQTAPRAPEARADERTARHPGRPCADTSRRGRRTPCPPSRRSRSRRGPARATS